MTIYGFDQMLKKHRKLLMVGMFKRHRKFVAIVDEQC